MTVLSHRLTLAAAALAFAVVVFGSYVRLSDAGLACPDWPGCYGQLTVPTSAADRAQAAALFPGRQVHAPGAWKEMIHRYGAGTLGLLIFTVAGLSLRRGVPARPTAPLLLTVLVIFQALLGMWTVTRLLQPTVVLLHLLGGFATLTLLGWMALRPAAPSAAVPFSRAGLAAVAFVVVQVALGGWTSANYAALACPDFPTCNGAWWPRFELSSVFASGALEPAARAGTHMMHRAGAVLVVAAVVWFALTLLRRSRLRTTRFAAAGLIVLVALQFLIGMGNVLLGHPLPLAVAHNAVAALLLVTTVLTLQLDRNERRAVLIYNSPRGGGKGHPAFARRA